MTAFYGYLDYYVPSICLQICECGGHFSSPGVSVLVNWSGMLQLSLGRGTNESKTLYEKINVFCPLLGSGFTNRELNPLNPNIKIQILICYPYTSSTEVVGRIC